MGPQPCEASAERSANHRRCAQLIPCNSVQTAVLFILVDFGKKYLFQKRSLWIIVALFDFSEVNTII